MIQCTRNPPRRIGMASLYVIVLELSSTLEKALHTLCERKWIKGVDQRCPEVVQEEESAAQNYVSSASHKYKFNKNRREPA